MIDYFVICHDQNLILDFIKEDKFSELPNYKFLFVGNKQTDLIEVLENVIICNKLKDNIEHYPKLCSFTAWYAVSKNNLPQGDYCCLLEYDIELSKGFHEENLKIISNSDLCAYLREPINDPMFSKSTPWLDLILKECNIDTKKIYNKEFWYCTTNFIINNNLLKDFNDWFYKIADVFKNDDLGSYMHERMINIYFIINDYNIEYIENKLKHFQLCSHKKEDLYGLSKRLNVDLNNLYEEKLEKINLIFGE